jgi:threonine 3-dehydrogenase
VLAVKKTRPEPGFDLVEVPAPEIGPGDVLVDVAATSLCGVDLHVHAWDASGQAFVPRLPVIPGHETSGTVIAVGNSVTSVAVGDLVALESHIVCGTCRECRTGLAHLCPRQVILGLSRDGAFAEQVAIPASACFILPPGTDLQHAALFEPAGVAVHATQRTGSLTGRTVAISGCGPIGLVLISLARIAGAAVVIGIEPSEGRRALATARGAVALDPADGDVAAAVRELVPGGVDVGFEASGAGPALGGLLTAVRPGGDVVTVGHPGVVPVDVSRSINLDYITLRGVFGRRLWDTWELLSQLVQSNQLDLASLITDSITLSDLPGAMADVAAGGKVLVRPS